MRYQARRWARGAGLAVGHRGGHGAQGRLWGAGVGTGPRASSGVQRRPLPREALATGRVTRRLMAHRFLFPSGHMKLVPFSPAVP